MRSAFALQAEAALNAVTADLEGAKADRIAAYARLSALAGVEATFTGLSDWLLAVPVAAPTYGPVAPLTGSSFLAAPVELAAGGTRLPAERKRAIPNH